MGNGQHVIEKEDHYRLNISCKNIEITSSLKDYIIDKLHKVEKITNDIIDVEIKLEVIKLNHHANIIMHFSHFKVQVHADTTDMYATLDKAFQKLQHKLRKWKERIKDHHAKGLATTEIEIDILDKLKTQNDDLDAEIIEQNNSTLRDSFELPKVVRTKKYPMKILTLGEAVMKMELSNDAFMVYKSEEDQVMKIIYRRDDGSYGVMVPG